MPLGLPLRHPAILVFAALMAGALLGCGASQPQPWSPEADKIYHEIYHPIIDGG